MRKDCRRKRHNTTRRTQNTRIQVHKKQKLFEVHMNTQSQKYCIWISWTKHPTYTGLNTKNYTGKLCCFQKSSIGTSNINSSNFLQIRLDCKNVISSTSDSTNRGSYSTSQNKKFVPQKLVIESHCKIY